MGGGSSEVHGSDVNGGQVSQTKNFIEMSLVEGESATGEVVSLPAPRKAWGKYLILQDGDDEIYVLAPVMLKRRLATMHIHVGERITVTHAGWGKTENGAQFHDMLVTREQES